MGFNHYRRDSPDGIVLDKALDKYELFTDFEKSFGQGGLNPYGNDITYASCH
jgi:hypothetical protein